MDKMLKTPGRKIKDAPKTPGRNKMKWKVSDDISVTFEQHPYHKTAPIEHSGPHYHIEAPKLGYEHTRFRIGEVLPKIFE